MEKHNEPGKFTAVTANEWTANGEIRQNLRRNVIFRDNTDKTPAAPPLATFVSVLLGTTGTEPQSLWARLAKREAKTGGKVLAIPHNGNMLNGWIFRAARFDGSPVMSDWDAKCVRWEPLYEIYQYIGTGEAHSALAPNDKFTNCGIWDIADLNGNSNQPRMINTQYWLGAPKKRHQMARQARNKRVQIWRGIVHRHAQRAEHPRLARQFLRQTRQQGT